MKHSGIVVDFGAEQTCITPVEFGYASAKSSSNFAVNGLEIDKFHLWTLMQIEENREVEWTREVLYHVKKQFKELGNSKFTYELPDGQVIKSGLDSGVTAEEKLMLPYINKKLTEKSKKMNEHIRAIYQDQDVQDDFSDFLSPVTKKDTEEDITMRKSIIFKIMKTMH